MMARAGYLRYGVSYFLITLFFMSCSAPLLYAEVTVPEDRHHAWQAPLAGQSLLLSVARANSVVFAVGERGHILSRHAGSDQWIQSPVPTQALLTAVFMLDDQLGWAVGHDAVILKTLDGGKSWSILHQAPDEQRPLMDIWFRDKDNGFAIGAYGYLLHTGDGGKTWEPQIINEEHDFHLNAITPGEDGQLFIAAEAGYVYRSKDMGNTWDTLNPPYEGSFFDIVYLGSGRIVVAGLRGHVFVSENAGNDWREVQTGVQASLNSVIRLNNGQILIAGHSGRLLLSDAGHDSFYAYQFPDRRALSDIIETESNQVLIVGEGGARAANLCHLFSSELLAGCH